MSREPEAGNRKPEGSSHWEPAAHERLDVYKLAKELVVDVYRQTAHFPDSELYGLTSQIRRAAVSIPANIAEGAARGSHRELAHSVSIARGSVSELIVLIDLASDLGYLEELPKRSLRDKLRRIFAMASGVLRRPRAPRDKS